MTTSTTLTALTLTSLALTACGGKSKAAYDTMMGNDKSHDASFHADPAALPGTYVHIDDEDNQIWRFANNKVEVYRPKAATGCVIPRAYHFEGNFVVAEATPPCGTDRYEIRRQYVTASGHRALDLADGQGRYTLSPVDDAGARDAFFSFEIHPDLIPADMQSYIPKEPTDAAIAGAREAFRTEFTNAHVKLLKSVATLALPGSSYLNYAVDFSNGKASSVTDTANDSFLSDHTRTGVDCYLWTTEPKEVANFGGFDLSVAGVESRHSKQVNGLWTLEQLRVAADGKSFDRSPVVKMDLNTFRGNSLTVNFEAANIVPGTTDRLYTNLVLLCEKPRGPDVLTLADVKTALGDYFEISPK